MIKVSIIIASYNSEKYLEKCITSCIDQTYQNIEIVVVDDGSQDNSVNIASSLCALDKRIILHKKPNEGLVHTRKTGFKIATGAFIFFLDCDDYIEINAIELLVENSNNSQADIVIGGSVYEDEEGNFITSWRSRIEGKHQIDYLKAFFLSKIQPHIWGRLIRYELFEKVNVPNHYLGGEDLIANTMLLCYNNDIRVTTVDALLYHYLVRAKSLTNTFKPEQFLEFTNEIELVLNKVNLESQVINEWSQFMIKVAWRRYLRKGGREYLKNRDYVSEIHNKYFVHAKQSMNLFERLEIRLYRYFPYLAGLYSKIFGRLNLI